MTTEKYEIAGDWPAIEPIPVHDDGTLTNKDLARRIIRSGFACTAENYNTISMLQNRLLTALSADLPDPRAFLAMLASCGGILSGSWALWFILTAATWRPNDMDIVVPRPTAVQEVANPQIPSRIARRFFEALDYTQTSVHHIYPPSQVPRPDLQAHTVWKLRHPRTGHKVDIIESHTSYAIDALRRFHSSIARNGITPHHIFVMYPQWTFDGISIAEHGAVSRDIELKYNARGIAFVDSNANWEQPCGLACPDITRGVGRDGTVLYAPLTAAYLQVPPPELPAWQTWEGAITCDNAKCAACRSLMV